MGTIVTNMRVGVVATDDELRVHVHSKLSTHQRKFRDLVAELASGVLLPPRTARGTMLRVVTRPAPTGEGLLYLEHAWPPRDLDALDLGSVSGMADWLLLIRPRLEGTD